jgi:hypothetical protein
MFFDKLICEWWISLCLKAIHKFHNEFLKKVDPLPPLHNTVIPSWPFGLSATTREPPSLFVLHNLWMAPGCSYISHNFLVDAHTLWKRYSFDTLWFFII